MNEWRCGWTWVLVWTLLGLGLSCAAGGERGNEESSAWSAPPLERTISVRDGRTGEAIEFGELLDQLAGAQVVFLGEQHTDETTHRVELAIYEGLLERRGGAVVLAMEMFERDVQEVLDRYLSGDIDEVSFLEGARPWSNYRTGYRRLIERAKQSGGKVVASNFPLTLRRRMSMEGEGVLDSLEGEERRWAPTHLLANTPQYWRLVDNAVRGHIGMMGGPKDPSDPRLTATQSLWDNSMGEACALALDQNPGSMVLHVNGGFHSSYWDGTTRQLQLRKPGVSVKTVDIVPVSNPALSDPFGKPLADFVVYAEERATDLNDGRWSVHASRPVHYRLHLPETATDETPVPLLIWLGEHGLTARDGIALWKDRLGDEAAIAVLEPPYREVAADMGEGGRWFWADTFSSDIGLLATALDRVWGYLLRNLPIDETRVVIAGEGTGATVVAAVSLLSDTPVPSFAFSPRQFSKIKDFPLPLPELRGDVPPADKNLIISIGESDRDWWSAELNEYTQIGFENQLRDAVMDPWTRELKQENELRALLNLPPRSGREFGDRKSITLETDTIRARHWARLAALWESQSSGTQVSVVNSIDADDAANALDLSVHAASYREERRLPACPGPFGGTTVLVLGEGIDQAESDAWFALERDDPLSARSRFLRLRIARSSGDGGLPGVLAQLREANRRNVLIVPAEFCAGVVTMRRLAGSIREYDDSMTLHWMPGLGGSR